MAQRNGLTVFKDGDLLQLIHGEPRQVGYQCKVSLMVFIARLWQRLGVLLLLVAAPLYATPQAPHIQLASEFNPKVDIRAFLVSEKLDGVRGYWDGQRFWTRQGHPIIVPEWFSADFPPIPLDGELWLGRGQFDAVSGLIRQSSGREEDWRAVRFMVFDLPHHAGTFAERYQFAQQLIQGKSPYIQVIEQFSVESLEQLYQTLDSVVAQGAEGLMLHRRSALYRAGRNPHLMKLKPYFDAEAKVMAHIAGKGQFAGLMGALRVQTPDGRIFSLGTGFTVTQRQHPPAIGAIVTYKYLGLTSKGLPRFARFLRVRSESEPSNKADEQP